MYNINAESILSYSVFISSEPGDIATSKSAPLPYTKSGIDKVLHEGDFSDWLSNKIVPRTWRSLYNVLGELYYGEELSQQIESYLCGE